MISYRCNFGAMLPRCLLASGIALMTPLLAGGGPALAGTEPAAFVSAFGEQLHLVASSASPDQRRAGFRRLFEADVDVPGLGRFILGRFQRALTAAEQRQFLCLFENYVVVAFGDQRLSEFAADAAPVVTGARADEDGVTVHSRIMRGTATTVEVDWRLTPRDGGYKIADIVIGGLSLAANGRSELEGVVARNGGQARSILAVLQQETAGYSTPAAAGRCYQIPAEPPTLRADNGRRPGRE